MIVNDDPFEHIELHVDEDEHGKRMTYTKNGRLVCGFCTYGQRALTWHETRLTDKDGQLTVTRQLLCEYCLKMAGVPPWATKSWRDRKKVGDGESLTQSLTRAQKEEVDPRYRPEGRRMPCRHCKQDVLMYMTAYNNPMYMHTARVSAGCLHREDQWSYARNDRRVHLVPNKVDDSTSVMFPHWLVCPVKQRTPPSEWTLRAIWGSMGGSTPVDSRWTDALLPEDPSAWGTETPPF